MHQKYARDGFAAVSVSLDDLSEKGNKERVLAFLKEKKATFTNLILDEPSETWQAKLKLDGPPLILVYRQDGTVAKRFSATDNEVDYKQVEKVVLELMKK